jgi:EAL domain-containing protein (putative c-di-GMP-specific phosphodiesterase class I)
VVDLTHVLGMEAVAEGVEPNEQATRLWEVGCRLAQGYHYSEPLPAEAMEGLLTERHFST